MRILCALFLSCSVCIGQISPPFLAAATAEAPGGGCSTSQDSITAAQNSIQTFAFNDTTLFIAQKFTAGATYTLCRADVYLGKEGSPTGNMSIHVYSHDAVNDMPETSLGESTDTIDVSTLTTSEAIYTFDEGLSVSISSGTIYWLVIEADSFGDVSNRPFWYVTSPAQSGNSVIKDGNGTGDDWSGGTTARSAKFVAYGE